MKFEIYMFDDGAFSLIEEELSQEKKHKILGDHKKTLVFSFEADSHMNAEMFYQKTIQNLWSFYKSYPDEKSKLIFT